MKKKLMILGAGDAQLNLIKMSLAQGYETVVCDMRPEMEGAKLADRYYPVNYMDRTVILEIARREKIDGVISNSEPAMLNVAYLCEELGLPGNSVESVETLLSKAKFRAVQKKAGVFAPKYAHTSTAEELLDAAKGMKFPVIVKPSESSGTRGVTKLAEPDGNALRIAFQTGQAFSRDDLVSIEEYVEPASLRYKEADIFVVNGEILWDGWFWAYRSKDRPFLPMASVFPMTLPEEQRLAVQAVIEKILRTAGIRLGEYNVETYDTRESDVFVIEINPRQGGHFIPQLIEEHCGVSLTRLLVSTAVGDLSYYNFLKTFHRDKRYITRQTVYSKADGVYEDMYIAPEIAQYVKWQELFVKRGDRVSVGCNAEKVLALIDLEFDSLETQSAFTDEIERYIHPILKR